MSVVPSSACGRSLTSADERELFRPGPVVEAGESVGRRTPVRLCPRLDLERDRSTLRCRDQTGMNCGDADGGVIGVRTRAPDVVGRITLSWTEERVPRADLGPEIARTDHPRHQTCRRLGRNERRRRTSAGCSRRRGRCLRRRSHCDLGGRRPRRRRILRARCEDSKRCHQTDGECGDPNPRHPPMRGTVLARCSGSTHSPSR